MIARPRVWIACTDEDTAEAVRKATAKVCLDYGCALRAGPAGGPSFFSSAEELFEELTARHPVELFDTLLIVYLGVDLEECFGSRNQQLFSDWHKSRTGRTGVALELLLQFPQLFPVFLTPALGSAGAGHGPQFAEWMQELIKDATTDTKLGWIDFQDAWDCLHFASTINGYADLEPIIQRFAEGLRTLFDPTGFRTLVRNRFLGQVFGSGVPGSDYKGWDNTLGARKLLSERLLRVAAVFDEEPDLVLLCGYAAYKFGYRVWMVGTHAEFRNEVRPAWRYYENLLVVRDLDLRYPDLAEAVSEKSLRQSLKDVDDDQWKSRLLNPRRVRVLTAESKVSGERQKRSGWSEKEEKLGQRNLEGDKFEYIGLRKPLQSIYAAAPLFDPKEKNPVSFMGRLPKAEEKKDEIGHGAPYINLRIADALIEQSRVCRSKENPANCLIGAVLAQEAFCLLLWMSRNTALEALREIHLAEAQAEACSTGITHAVQIQGRRHDLQHIVQTQIPGPAGYAFLSKIWSELRRIYRLGEQFEAAELANRESLIFSYSTLMERWPRQMKLIAGVERWIFKPVHSVFALLFLFLALSLVLTIAYCMAHDWGLAFDLNSINLFLHSWYHVIISMSRAESLSLNDPHKPNLGELAAPHSIGFKLIDLASGISSLFIIGLLAAVLFRKITRG